MNEQLFIPNKVRIGFQKRNDTYNGQLAYVIYYDSKGELRKAGSWERWRSKDIEPVDYPNEPTEGFVLNKGVGGQRESYSWNARNEYVRVFDPRGFEFEISVANLLFILRETGCSPGKGLEGTFVYAWHGSTLILLPTGCQEYKNSTKFTELQGQGVLVKDLIPGATYITKKQVVLTYLGKFDYYFVTSSATSKKDKKGVMPKFVFWDRQVEAQEDVEFYSYRTSPSNFVYLNDLKSIARLESDVIASDYADLVDKYNKSAHGSKVVDLYLIDESVVRDRPDNYGDRIWFREESAGIFTLYRTSFRHNSDVIDHIYRSLNFFLKDGRFMQEGLGGTAYNKNDGYYHAHSNMEWVEPTTLKLIAVTENGAKIKVGYNNFSKG